MYYILLIYSNECKNNIKCIGNNSNAFLLLYNKYSFTYNNKYSS